jgi:hypothetical protein
VTADLAAAELLELSDERDKWQHRLYLAAVEAYRRGYDDGQFDAKVDGDKDWASRPRTRVSLGPSHAELEQRRYGPGGRASWLLPDDQSPNVRRGGDPRPGDYLGQAG